MRVTSGLDARASCVDDDASIVELLRARDEGAFAVLIDRYHSVMLRVAIVYVRDRAVAQDVVQDAWVGVLRGIDRFEARSSLKTWIFRIVVSNAKRRAARESRTLPLSAVNWLVPHSLEAAVEPDRFLPADDPRWPGHWVSMPPVWAEAADERLLAGETLAMVRAAIDALPAKQREVVYLRDAQGWSADEVCNVLRISDTNQRVLLHRGRSRVRRALERYFTGL